MKDLTRGNIYKTFLLFGIPLVLSGLLSQSYSIVDTMIAGRVLREQGLAAVGSTAGLVQLTCSLLWGYDSGFTIQVAQMFGAGDFVGIRKNILHNLGALFVVCLGLGGLMLLFHEGIFSLLRIETGLRREAFAYFSVYVGGLYFIILNDAFLKIFNAIGDSRMSFLMSCLAAVLNISGNLLAVVLLEAGVIGLAVASVVSAALVDLCYFLRLLVVFRRMGLKGVPLTFEPALLGQTVRFAMPTSGQQAVMYFSSAAASPFVNAIGSSATAAYTVVMKIFDVNACIYQGASMTVSNYSAQCVGSGQQEKLRRGVRVGALQALVFLLPALLACALWPQPIARFFFSAGAAEEAVAYAVEFLRYFLPFLAFNAVNNLFHAFYRGVRAMKFLVAVTAVGAASRVAATVLLAPHWGMTGVYAAWAISWAIEAVVTLLLYRTGGWKKPLVAR